MNKILPLVCFLCLFYVQLSAQNTASFYLLEVNETHTPAFRDENGNIHMYYTIHGMSTVEEINTFTSGVYHFGGVVENEVVNTTPDNVTFHTVLLPEVNASILRKMFYMQNVTQLDFFGENMPTTEFTGEIMKKYIQL
jgi:hypothetical protein